MSEKRFIVENDNNEVSIKDNVKDNYPFALAYEHIDDADNLIQECLSLVGLLNEQQTTIDKLREEVVHNFAQKVQLHKEIRELKEEEKLYANEIVRLNKNIEELNKTIEEALKFKSLGGDY